MEKNSKKIYSSIHYLNFHTIKIPPSRLVLSLGIAERKGKEPQTRNWGRESCNYVSRETREQETQTQSLADKKEQEYAESQPTL